MVLELDETEREVVLELDEWERKVVLALNECGWNERWCWSWTTEDKRWC